MKEYSNFLFEKNLLSVNMQAMADFIHYLDYPVDVKDVKHGQYILNNRAAAAVSGLTPEERIGLNAYDIAVINKIKNTALRKLIAADNHVTATGIPTRFNHYFLNKAGLVVLDKVIKKPILGPNNKTIAILSYAHELTSYVELSKLYSLYKVYYSKKLAIQFFLSYLNIMHFFNTAPTEQELQTLLAMQANLSASKYVAKLMRISPRTVEYYKSRLCHKLRLISLDQLLVKLRTQSCHDSLEEL